MKSTITNGRVYDPLIARFLSPDIFVQGAGSSQGYNGYSYVVNNPLTFVDPSGWNWSATIGRRSNGEPYDDKHFETDGTGGAWGSYYSSYGAFTPISSNSYIYNGKYYTTRNLPGPTSGGHMNPMESSVYNGFNNAVGQGAYYGSIQIDANGGVSGTKTTYHPVMAIVDGKEYKSSQVIELESKISLEDQSGGDGSIAVPLTAAGLSFLAIEGGQGAGTALMSQAESIRAAAIKNGMPTDAIDDIMRSTNNFSNMSKVVGRSFIYAGAVVSVMDLKIAHSNGDVMGMQMAGMDLVVGLGTAAVGGPVGLIIYGGYVIVMHAPKFPTPAYMTNPYSPYNRDVRIDNTYVETPNY